MNEGDEVEFEVSEGRKGPEAQNVVVTKKAPRQERTYRRNPNYRF
ncbi:MAG: cold shock domain-containing protein [Promethearchaeota archaeon]